ncbi:MAG: hypothetical protein P8P83_05780 [Rickettsiaceae bacterium]|nr:hypothetical protein [Rickettsiaceae bacterium]
MKKINSILVLILLLSSNFALAEDQQNSEPKAKLRDPAEFQKVIDEYKTYVAKISPEIRDEVIAFRKEIAKLNREKKTLYIKLSTASQNYLKEEQYYKKKLPLNRKSLINMEDPGNKIKKSKEK